jgi:hypothetical protein
MKTVYAKKSSTALTAAKPATAILTCSIAANLSSNALAAVVPKPRAPLTRHHGVFAPASPDRARIVPKTRAAAANEPGETSATDRQRALSFKRNASDGCSPSC